ncbi:predicted protein [Heterostelium album PN500]|uniref:Glycoside hydrolase 35 catalytic domain-containing protein n=1 Tax=Heterostelium pallidum (strain ATCC 26659 / Pp 5 / PN500) TaxID=670386 RepID=D3BPY9_HETP5|nr:predicted protein [Heterostelium album PN500]EFA76540.1 predicted protein [Heterostelium album PN500]|eukprot:XP_020428672.1 predicted protein [Heterostelium album PN500]
MYQDRKTTILQSEFGRNVDKFRILFLIVFMWLVVGFVGGIPHKITYDKRSLIIDGQRVLLISGSVHYPRSTPSMWRPILQQTKAAGINLIDTYVFWDVHEPQKGVFNFEGNADISHFLDICKDLGLYVNLRIGPYVRDNNAIAN